MENKNLLKKFFTGRKGRQLREYLTAYTFIAPATILIFIFGIFPVGFALYVSLHKWRIKRTKLIGLENYTDAVGNLAYVVIFFLGIGALIAIYFLLKNILKMAREHNERPWLCIIPGIFNALIAFSLLNWIYNALPEVLGIADKLRGLKRSQEVFMRLLGEAFRAESVLPAWRLFVWILMAGIVVAGLVWYLWRNPRNFTYQAKFGLIFLALGVGIGLLYYTQHQISLVYEAAVATDTDPGIWPQFITITSGVLLLGLGWYVWKRAEKQVSNLSFWLHVLATMVLLVGGWLLIGEIPTIVAAGDKDLWKGLKVTVFFALGTVPFQLAISLFLSILLFQKLFGANIFRIIFFIPYVTPAIASAAVFKQMFSNRHSAPVNMFIQALGGNPQQWLFEPKGIFTLLGNNLGLNTPDWAAGPSLALLVIIIHSVWTYVGYDTVIYMAGLGNIPTELVDAAEVDGANKWQIFRHITFPLLSPTTYFLSLIAIIGTFKAFNTIWIFRDSLALGTTDTFSVTIFIEFFEKLRYGYASAMAFVLFAIILALTYVNNKVQGSRVFYG
ncbi:MAG: ABC transporter permease subunit [Anaerolineaceae bacterium]|jgi:multiple sugar transport system permease protein|nr:ABC transporter permease subunit [Anaerolineaceae bacterium]